MKQVAKLFKVLLLIIVGIAILIGVFENYSFIFARNVTGPIMEVERVTQAMALIGSGAGNDIPASQMYSFAVAIKDKASGEIFTSSSEDRQWAVAKKGFCVEAKFYPYPPWNFEKAGTYFNARLMKLFDCPPGQGVAPLEVGAAAELRPAQPSPPPPAATP